MNDSFFIFFNCLYEFVSTLYMNSKYFQVKLPLIEARKRFHVFGSVNTHTHTYTYEHAYIRTPVCLREDSISASVSHPTRDHVFLKLSSESSSFEGEWELTFRIRENASRVYANARWQSSIALRYLHTYRVKRAIAAAAYTNRRNLPVRRYPKYSRNLREKSRASIGT